MAIVALTGVLPAECASRADRLGFYTRCEREANGKPCYKMVGNEQFMIWFKYLERLASGAWLPFQIAPLPSFGSGSLTCLFFSAGLMPPPTKVPCLLFVSCAAF